MTLKDHNRHTELKRPECGTFGRNEYAITGTTCGKIRLLCDTVIRQLVSKCKCGYVDAIHADEAGPDSAGYISYMDKPASAAIEWRKKPDKYKFYQLFNETDLILVNGNHHVASRQVLVIDRVKEASMKKKIGSLDNIVLILLSDPDTEIFDFVKTAVPHWQNVPVLRLDDTGAIANFFAKQVEDTTPAMNGLVLAGGRSTRLGNDKSIMTWHGKEQRYHLADLLARTCHEVYISCRDDQQMGIKAGYTALPDTFTGLGPYGAILSAFRKNPQTAWLVIACDLPLVDESAIIQLQHQRNPSAIATTFESPYDGLPEPLITIWEPRAYPILLSFLAQGYSCPRKVLRNNETAMIQASDPNMLLNVNTADDAEKARRLLTEKISGV